MAAPTKFLWSAPTQRADGSPLSQEEIAALVYTIGFKLPGEDNYTETASFPGTLNPDGDYEANFTDFNLPQQDFTAAIKATDREGRGSPWSQPVAVPLAPAPKAPTNFRAV